MAVSTTAQQAVAHDADQTKSIKPRDFVPAAIKKETDEPPKKIIKLEPCDQRDRSGIASREKVVVGPVLIDLTESGDEIAEFELIDEIGDGDPDVICLTPSVENEKKRRGRGEKAADRPAATSALMSHPQVDLDPSSVNALAEVINNGLSSARIIEELGRLRYDPSEKKEEESGGKVRSVKCTDRGKPYDRARDLVKKSVEIFSFYVRKIHN